MAETKHTPGPWEFDGNCGGYITQAGDRIARAYAAADALLIAAAPDLVEACASVWLLLSDTGDNELRLIADECRAAIAKATAR